MYFGFCVFLKSFLYSFSEFFCTVEMQNYSCRKHRIGKKIGVLQHERKSNLLI